MIRTDPDLQITPSTSDWVRGYRHRLFGGDAVVAVAAVAIALIMILPNPEFPQYALISPFVVMGWLALLTLSRAYESRFLAVTVEECRAVATSAFLALSLTAIATTLAQVAVSRWYLLTVSICLVLFTLANRGVAQSWLRRHRRAGRSLHTAIVIGRLDTATTLVRSLQADPMQGLRPVAVCALGASPLDGAVWELDEIAHIPVVGEPLDAVAAVDRFQADAVVVASHADLSGTALRRLSWALEERHVELLVAPGLLDVAGARVSLRPSTELALLHVERPGAARVNVLFKSLFDRLGALALLLVFSPVLIATAAAIRLSSPGPVIFRQVRIGKGGRPFTIFKFRTMVNGADQVQQSLVHLNEGNAVQFKLRQDPRVTPVGKFLRRYSLDELPQLFNVLLGTMSLVGPRPQSQAEVDQYGSDALRRLKVSPGMTGLWQVSGRSDLDWDQSVKLDLRYVDNYSPVLDLVILLRTFKAVFAPSGAY